jgi:hypothetical protein
MFTVVTAIPQKIAVRSILGCLPISLDSDMNFPFYFLVVDEHWPLLRGYFYAKEWSYVNR